MQEHRGGLKMGMTYVFDHAKLSCSLNAQQHSTADIFNLNNAPALGNLDSWNCMHTSI